jgi:hypothetical protein
MAITSGLCASAKRDFMLGVHQPSDTYKLALYDESATISPLTDVFTTAGEVKGQNYPKGGVVLSGYAVNLTGTKANLGFSRDVIIPNASISALGGMIYNASKDNLAVGIIEFAEKITSTNGNFKVLMGDLFWIE